MFLDVIFYKIFIYCIVVFYFRIAKYSGNKSGGEIKSGLNLENSRCRLSTINPVY